MHLTNRRRSGLPYVALACLLALSAATALAQDEQAHQRLQRLHDDVTRADRVLSAEDGKRALRELHKLNLATDKLDPANQALAVRVKIYAALAVGDARRAAQELRALQELLPDRCETLEAAYLVAFATGDAQLGERAVHELRKLVDFGRRRELSRCRRWFRNVGNPAPQITITVEDGAAVKPAERDGVVLLIDFWSVLFPPTDEQVAGLRELHEIHQRDPKIAFLGVNTNSATRVEEAQAFAQKAGYVWSQHYEHGSGQGGSVSRAFGAGTPPWQIVVDQYGYIRVVGTMAEPAFQYALRAVVAEAKRRYDPVLPRTRDGKQAAPKEAVADAGRRAEREQQKAAPSGGLPSNPEAAQKLRLARTFMKTGRRTDAKRLFEEVVRDYPGTREAKLAQEYLDSWR